MRELIYNLPDVVGIIVTVLTSLSGFGVCVVSLHKTQENDKKPGKAFWTSILITVLVIAICIVFFVLKGNLYRVPELNGWTYYNAIQTLDERNISYEFVSNDFDKDNAKITYQSLGNNELIYSWEKLVLGTSDELEKPSTLTTSTNATISSPDNTSANNHYSSETSQESTANDKASSDVEPYELILYADNQGGKWGFVDQFGKEQIPHIYDWANDFIDGYAAVCKNNNWGIIDTSGNEVIPFEYDGAYSFIDGLAPVFKDGKWGFIDINGDVKIPFKFPYVASTWNGGDLVYIDENNNIIDYDTEMSIIQSLES